MVIATIIILVMVLFWDGAAISLLVIAWLPDYKLIDILGMEIGEQPWVGSLFFLEIDHGEIQWDILYLNGGVPPSIE